jgi:hypothetical protein
VVSLLNLERGKGAGFKIKNEAGLMIEWIIKLCWCTPPKALGLDYPQRNVVCGIFKEVSAVMKSGHISQEAVDGWGLYRIG